MVGSSHRTSRVIIIHHHHHQHHHHIRSQDRGDYLYLTFLFLELCSPTIAITESETRKKSLENSRHFLWLLINLIEFQESETLPTKGSNYNTTPQQPHLARQVCATFYSPWHNSLSEAFRKISTPRNFHLSQRYSHAA